MHHAEACGTPAGGLRGIRGTNVDAVQARAQANAPCARRAIRQDTVNQRHPSNATYSRENAMRVSDISSARGHRNYIA